MHDPRLLRVLDADQADGLCYVVNEWGSGDSLDIMLADDGPLGPRRAAWLVSEVAASIAAGHEAGVAHGRLIPENVLVDHTGAVRLIGFAVDAAMHGLPPGPGLRPTSPTWAGCSTARSPASGRASPRPPCPGAPLEQGRVLRPRQVRAGIPRPLDALCDEVVNPYSGAAGARLREVHDVATAHGHRRLPVRLRRRPHRAGRGRGRRRAPRPTETTSSLPAIADPPARDADPAPEPEPARAASPSPTEPEPEPEPVVDELPTEAGLPIFDDETDDVSWLTAPAEPAPPPPPFEEPPERPLFAPSPAGGAPARDPAPIPAEPARSAAGPARVLALGHRHRQRLRRHRTTRARGGARAATGCGSRP